MKLANRRKQILFKSLALLFFTLIILFGADLYLHHKHGINLHGYRGPTLGQKREGEKRLAVLGSSTTWGYGVQTGQDFPAQLQRLLAQSPELKHPGGIQVVNLGANSEGVYSFKFTLNDYDYLDCDAVILYSGYNDLKGPNYYVFRHRLPVFDWTGYLPLLPLLTADKLAAWKRQLSAQNDRAIFQPSSPTGDGSFRPPSLATTTLTANTDACANEWKLYCDEMYAAVDLALKKRKRVLVVTEPYISDAHIKQQLCLEQMLTTRFAGNPSVRYLNLGRAIDLRDRTVCRDGMHLTEEGNRRIAMALAPRVVELLQ